MPMVSSLMPMVSSLMPMVSSARRISSELRRDKGKPVVRRGRKATGLVLCEAAELPNRVVEKRRRLLDMDEQDSAVLSEDAIVGASLLLLQATWPRQCRQLKRAMGKLQQALEEVESALLECEEALGTESSVPPRTLPWPRKRGAAVYRTGLPGAWDGQELGLQQD